MKFPTLFATATLYSALFVVQVTNGAESCPSFSIDVEGDSCKTGEAFNEAFTPIYEAAMLYSEAHTDNDRVIDFLGQNAAALRNFSTIESVHILDTKGTVISKDGVFSFRANDDRRLLEEDHEEEDLQDHRELYNCDPRSWCLRFNWCCVVCPHHCYRRQLQPAKKNLRPVDVAATKMTNAKLGSAPMEDKGVCWFVENKIVPTGCLAEAKLICEEVV
jgi:hypothetical protein